jgi:hypothetical protein
VIEVGAGIAQLLAPGVPALSHLLHKPLPPWALLHRLRQAGVGLVTDLTR